MRGVGRFDVTELALGNKRHFKGISVITVISMDNPWKSPDTVWTSMDNAWIIHGNLRLINRKPLTIHGYLLIIHEYPRIIVQYARKMGRGMDWGGGRRGEHIELFGRLAIGEPSQKNLGKLRG